MFWLSVVEPYTIYPGGRFFFTYEGYKVFERRTLLWRRYDGNVRVFSTTDYQLYELMGHYGGISLYYQDKYQVNYSAKTKIGLKALCRFLEEG